jgi:hypothetical protein
MPDTQTVESPGMLEYFESEKSRYVGAAEEIITNAKKEFRGVSEAER